MAHVNTALAPLDKARALPLIVAAYFLLSNVQIASAMCPLCVAGAAAGLSIARFYGVDDAIVGIWLGALAISSAMWISRSVRNKYGTHAVPMQSLVVWSVVIAATIIPFYAAGFFKGMPNMIDTMLGINKVLFGTAVGAIATYASPSLSREIKRHRDSALPYQSTLLTLAMLALLSMLLWYLTSNYHIV